MRALSLTGQKFGLLTAIESVKIAATGRPRTMWRCKCDCGNTVITGTEPLRRGLTRSCGCLRQTMLATRSVTHGHTKGGRRTKEYRAWLHAKGRCYRPNDAKFPIYGGRGITMCDEWLDDFASFFRDMGPCPIGLSLDRINVNGHYEPGNCRWATAKQQAINTRTNVMVANSHGDNVALKTLAYAYRINYGSLHAAVRRRGDDPLIAAKRLARRAHRS